MWFMYIRKQGSSRCAQLWFADSQGNMISFLDADDLWSDDKLELQLSCFKKTISWNRHRLHQRMQLLSVKDGNMSSGIIRPCISYEFCGIPNQKSALIKWSYRWKLPTMRRLGLVYESKELNVSMVVHKEVIAFYRRHDDNMTTI